MNDKNKILICSNCERKGHMYKNCIYPITSYGIICVKHDLDNSVNDYSISLNNQTDQTDQTNIRYLLIQRKHSMGYVEVIRGKYNINNIGYLKIMLSIMTNGEKENILTKDFKSLWDDLWINRKHNDKYNKEYKDAYNKFLTLKGILINETTIGLEQLIKESGNMWDDTEWGFPKGRKNFKETKIGCALREFREETGISIDLITLLNIKPKVELFIGTNGIMYKHEYYFAIYKGNDTNNIINVDIHNKLQYAEVSKIKWMTLSEACNTIRPYNIEKINILNDSSKILSEFITLLISK